MEAKEQRTLILGWPVKPVQSWIKEVSLIDAARIYKEDIGKLKKKFKDLSFHLPQYLQLFNSIKEETWFGDWKYDIEKYDKVIIIDEIRGRTLFDFILKKNPKVKLYVFYDSPIRKGTPKEPSNYKDLPVKFCSCDRNIAKTYNIKFVPAFYIFSPYNFNSYSEKFENNIIKQDVFFVGEEKADRKEQLNKIKLVLDKAGISSFFRLVSRNKRKRAYMPYDEVIENIKSSRAILELISDGQTGLTQRPYEALFFGKKLITTSAEIKSYDFYDARNVFLLDEQSIEKLPDFLKEDFAPISKRILEEYTLESWVQRFE